MGSRSGWHGGQLFRIYEQSCTAQAAIWICRCGRIVISVSWNLLLCLTHPSTWSQSGYTFLWRSASLQASGFDLLEAEMHLESRYLAIHVGSMKGDGGAPAMSHLPGRGRDHLVHRPRHQKLASSASRTNCLAIMLSLRATLEVCFVRTSAVPGSSNIIEIGCVECCAVVRLVRGSIITRRVEVSVRNRDSGTLVNGGGLCNS